MRVFQVKFAHSTHFMKMRDRITLAMCGNSLVVFWILFKINREIVKDTAVDLVGKSRLS